MNLFSQQILCDAVNRRSQCVAFPRTLTLSLGEREQQSVLAIFRQVVRQIQSQVFQKDGAQFSLSRRERAGVRGTRTKETPGSTISNEEQ
jgi:hypothetical protein